MNGRASKRVEVVFLASGTSGRAEVRAVASEGDGAIRGMEISVILPTGEVIRVGPPKGSGGGGTGSVTGSVVDVEWKEV